MNTPNKLTCLRMLLVPVCLVLAYLKLFLPAAAVFGIAALTDTLDGQIARRQHIVTNFGKFADPIADKLLTVTMMIFLSCNGTLPVWLSLVVVTRELAVDGLRLIAVERGQVIAAGIWGKVKTTAQIILVLAALILPLDWLMLSGSIIICVLTVYSGFIYFWNARDLFKGDFGL